MDTALDVWFRFENEGDEEAEAEANTFRDDSGYRVEWYNTAVGLVHDRWFATRRQARAWLESEGFLDFTA